MDFSPVNMEKRKHETDDDSDEICTVLDVGTPKAKMKKKRSAGQKFVRSHREAYPCLVASRKGEEFAHCTICKTDFSVKHGGLNDCTKHVRGKSHKEFEKSKSAAITSFFVRDEAKVESVSSLDDDVTKAEAILCRLLVESNLPLSAAGKMTEAIQVMCHDSKIAASKC